MGIVIAVWLSRFDAAVLLRLVRLIGWIASVLLPRSSLLAARSRAAGDRLAARHARPAHPGPGMWYMLPRAALIGWSIAGAAAAAHNGNVRAVIGHHPVGTHAP
jgi:hypothetical protein